MVNNRKGPRPMTTQLHQNKNSFIVIVHMYNEIVKTKKRKKEMKW